MPDEHYPRATAVLTEGGSICGYDAKCSCGWRGGHYSIPRFSLAEARTCAMLLATAHAESQPTKDGN